MRCRYLRIWYGWRAWLVLMLAGLLSLLSGAFCILTLGLVTNYIEYWEVKAVSWYTYLAWKYMRCRPNRFKAMDDVDRTDASVDFVDTVEDKDSAL